MKKQRRCLKCLRDFISRDNANRVCYACKTDRRYVTAVACMPGGYKPSDGMRRARPGVV